MPPNVSNPSVWFSAMQKKLRGGNVNERSELTKGFFAKYYNEDEPSVEAQEKFFNAYFEDIDNERARIGGDWVVPHAILIDKSVRDLVRYKKTNRIRVKRKQFFSFLRSHFGTENLIIILLTLPEDTSFERVKQRHNGAEDFAHDFQDWGKKAFDPVKEEEECVHVLEIEDQMTGEEVVDKILKIVEKEEKRSR